MSLAAEIANAPASWEAQRGVAPATEAVRPEPCPTYEHRVHSILAALAWCWSQQSATKALQPPAVLDVSAGVGAVGQIGLRLAQQGVLPPFHYAATEQSEKLRLLVKERVPGACVAEWRFLDSLDEHHILDSLAMALETASDLFLRLYPTVLLSHILEHVSDPYGLIDEAWRLIAPGGFLVVCVPRNDEHRTHAGLWDWNKLLAVLRQYAPLGQPMAVWEDGYWADLLVVVPKGNDGSEVAPRASASGGYDVMETSAAHGAEMAKNGTPPITGGQGWNAEGIQIKAHVDPRIRSDTPIGEYQTKVYPGVGGA